MTIAPVPLNIPAGTFKEDKVNHKEETTVESCEKLVALMTDPVDLLYESMLRREPEQITRSNIYNYIGTKKTMPYKPLSI
ncbi:hypothetical protein TVAG_111410 [Trichomonas vaginalis G3]|uniref:Uncharacterized protein n=1 Tax=Trichomonas vaginalis (strain ATCC PRA-98 / G3) TaxID=412133 RepID=A2F000_TRIV3|nr:hypothetical protein TVAGG3_0144680 [Trichomonas vaginalis G3]EAY01784.1 hypothetical protein TVAG_111410 [Trichomonas vaginalis G3]KAI5546834.1 hypothetical protein TVAGG3_0144680 [Trichomonas vaginalis G3]|eukprot:XP_001314342.1 hypothetical protein [Trichomonas vaginalis G3]